MISAERLHREEQAAARKAEARRPQMIPTESAFASKNNRPLDEKAVKKMAHSLNKVGLQHAIIVVDGDGRQQVVCGATRLAAAKLLGWKHIEAIVLPEDTSEKEILLRRTHENNVRQDVSIDATLQQIDQVMKAYGVDHAEAINLTLINPTTASKIRTTCKRLIGGPMAYARKQGLPLSVCYEAARGSSDPETQMRWLTEHAAGRMTRQQIIAAGKRLKTKTPPTEKLVRVEVEIEGVAIKVAMPKSITYEKLGKVFTLVKARFAAEDKANHPIDLLPRLMTQGGEA